MPTENETTKSCVACASSIPEAATLCKHCNTPQGLNRYLALSNTTLALIVAIISVISTGFPAFYKVVHQPVSDAVVSDISFDGNYARVTVVNSGDAPAVLSSAFVVSDFLAATTKVRLTKVDQAVLSPGTSLLVFDIIPLLDEGESYAQSLDALSRIIKKRDDNLGFFSFGITQSDGKKTGLQRDITPLVLFELLRSNADRCSAVTKPNFENGCIGTASKAQKRYDVSGPRLNDKREILD